MDDKQAYCYQCQGNTPYWTRFENTIQQIEGLTLDLLLESAYCKTCNSPVAPQVVGEKNVQRIYRAYEALSDC